VLDTVSSILGRSIEVRYAAARDFDVPVSVLSIVRAKQLMGWMPKISFEQGVERFSRWLSEDELRLR